MSQQLERMKKLIEEINEYNYHYYTMDNPLISDEDYNKLYDSLVALQDITGIELPSSPTRRVGGDVLPGFTQHTHISRLWSLDKAQNKTSLFAWKDRVFKAVAEYNAANPHNPLPSPTFVVELKFDGLTLNLTYNGGELVQIATRGDGTLSVINELYSLVQGKLTKSLKYAV